MSEDWKKSALGILKATSMNADKLANSLKNDIKSSGVLEKFESAAARTKEYLDEKGVTQKLQEASSTVGSHLDTLSGQKILELVQGRLELQARYNDVLATKLDEALKRIHALESDLESKKPKN